MRARTPRHPPGPRSDPSKGRIVPAIALLAAAAAALTLGGLALGRRARGGRARIASTPPGASVFVDGEFRGLTPLEVGGLAPGLHALRLEKSGFGAFFGSIGPLERGAAVSVPLEPILAGGIDVRTRPAGAEVFLDGEYRGRTPLSFDGVRAGEHALGLRKANHCPQTLTVRVAAGARSAVEADLEDRTLTYLALALEARPDDALRYMELGHYRRITGDLEGAVEAYRKGLMVSGRSLLLSRKLDHEQRSRVYGEHKLFARQLHYDKDPARSGPQAAEFAALMVPVTAEVGRLYPPEAMRAVRYAWQYESAGRIEEALKKVEGLVRTAPACSELREYLADLRLASGDAEGAVGAFKEALKLAEGSAGVVPGIGASGVVVRFAEACLEKRKKLDPEAARKVLGFSAGKLAKAAVSATGAEAEKIAELQAQVRREVRSLGGR